MSNGKYEYSNKVYESIKSGKGTYNVVLKKKYDMFIGIDPDVCRSGMAYWIKKERILEIYDNSFFEIFQTLNLLKGQRNVLVVIEAGWLNKGNWHTKKNGSAASNAKIGSHTGANAQVGKLLAEMCDFLDIDYELKRPTRSKVNAKSFRQITGYQGPTNQEKRDAALLVYKR